MFAVTQEDLDRLNVAQSAKENRQSLVALGGVEGLARKLTLNVEQGLSDVQVAQSKERFGANIFPEAPMTTFFELLYEALSDTTLIILMVAAIVSLAIEETENPGSGWIDGTSILIAVMLVSVVTSCNNYSKELQFRALEHSSQRDEKTTVIRSGGVPFLVNPSELVVGDVILLQVGDLIPADCVICDNNVVKSSEAGLTGEPEDQKKSKNGDCFLLSSCLITEGESVHAIVIGIGSFSQWGKIKEKLVIESVDTPLQEKLGIMAEQIGQIGLAFAIMTFVTIFISIFARDNGHGIVKGILDGFILAIVIIVVAIPEGLPLAVTISLAYSTGKMYDQNCNIRVLAACETMGNATTICSDKTGTLTQNRMTVVEGWFGDSVIPQEVFLLASSPCRQLADPLKEAIVDNCCINRIAILAKSQDKQSAEEHAEEDKVSWFDRLFMSSQRNVHNPLPTVGDDGVPQITGNKTEGALMLMVKVWGYEYDVIDKLKFKDYQDKKFSFNSTKKRSSTVIHRQDGSVRLLCKGAPEYVLGDCSSYFSNAQNEVLPLTHEKRNELEEVMRKMTERALRILCLAHRDFKSASDLPSDWHDNPPDNEDLVCDCIVGIIDPLRDDVRDAVATAQRAGVVVRMVTGDNISTASAIARSCGILTSGGLSLEGPKFRQMAPRELDSQLSRLQVLARSSPNDKYLLVTRLNGRLPDGEEEWKEYHKDSPSLTWEKDKDRVLPGYKEEWDSSEFRADRGAEIVGVTGDGTNDAPALKAANVGLSMGITGTKVAQAASDIIIRDDKFSSIVTAILWGRSVYDNIRKFLQFQLTVNVVALTLVLVGAMAGVDPPLNAIMMLWVNLIMDTMGALALGTEQPSLKLLDRKPYKLETSLISKPMWRHILCQSLFQLILLFIVLFAGQKMYNTNPNGWCAEYDVDSGNTNTWNALSSNKGTNGTITCGTFNILCSGDNNNQDCYEDTQTYNGISFKFSDLDDYSEDCLECKEFDYTLGTLVFNTFVWCQIYNEFNARSLTDEWNVFTGLKDSPVFVSVIVVTVVLQIILVELGGEFVGTSGLNAEQWFGCIFLAMITLPVGYLMRLIPIKEDPDSFVTHDTSDWYVAEGSSSNKDRRDISGSTSLSRLSLVGRNSIGESTDNILLQKLV